MKLLECKDKLTINELLQIAFEYGNDNADMPADGESMTEGFNEWIKESDELFKKLILPRVSESLPADVSDYIGKATAFIGEWIDNDRNDIREKLTKQGERLLNKYD